MISVKVRFIFASHIPLLLDNSESAGNFNPNLYNSTCSSDYMCMQLKAESGIISPKESSVVDTFDLHLCVGDLKGLAFCISFICNIIIQLVQKCFM